MLFFSLFRQLARLQQCLEELRQRQQAAAHRPSRRKAVRGPQAARVDEIRRTADPLLHMYLPVDLAYVDNVEEARVLSWAAGDSLDALVVQNEGLWKDLMEKNVKVPFYFGRHNSAPRRRRLPRPHHLPTSSLGLLTGP